MTLVDPVALARALIACPSVTPADAGSMALVREALERLGFACRPMRFGDVENLYARRGTARPNLCFAGHVDVVPPGDLAAWTRDPFAATVEGGVLHGRGAVDMKGAVAAWIAAVSRTPALDGSLSLLITGDEEGAAVDGTRRVVETLIAEGERVDHCLVGEPTSAERLGDVVKVGRRGSLNAWIMVEGTQGHVAYPDRAANPLPELVSLLERLCAERLDGGVPEFQPSNLELTAIEAPNPAQNVIPAHARARLNIRFNPAHTGAALVERLKARCAEAQAGFAGTVRLEATISGEAFYTAPGPFTDVVTGAVEAETGARPAFSTSGGTSDARFIRALCPVIELGLVGTTMHKVDEQTPVVEIEALTRIYSRVIERYFQARP